MGFCVSKVPRRDTSVSFNALILLQLYGLRDKGKGQHRLCCGKPSEQVWLMNICI